MLLVDIVKPGPLGGGTIPFLGRSHRTENWHVTQSGHVQRGTESQTDIRFYKMIIWPIHELYDICVWRRHANGIILLLTDSFATFGSVKTLLSRGLRQQQVSDDTKTRKAEEVAASSRAGEPKKLLARHLNSSC